MSWLRKVLCISVIAGVFIACNDSKEIRKKTDVKNKHTIQISADQFRKTGLELVSPEEDIFPIVVDVEGRIDIPDECRHRLNPPIEGVVKSVSITEGKNVRRGHAIIHIESDSFIGLQETYLVQAGKMDSLYKWYREQKRLYGRDTLHHQKYLAAYNTYRAEKENYENLRRELQGLNLNPDRLQRDGFSGCTVVYAPVTGNVMAIYADSGSFVYPEDVLMEIVDTDSLCLTLTVSRNDLPLLREGQEIKFYQFHRPGRVVTARLMSVAHTSSEPDKLEVSAVIQEDSRPFIRTGNILGGRIITGLRNALTLPDKALIEEENGHFIMLLENESKNTYTFCKVPVRTGVTEESRVEILPDEALDLGSLILRFTE